MSDLISRKEAIDVAFDVYPDDEYFRELFVKSIQALPSAQPDSSFITWLLDEIWDEDAWTLNWQAFPELVCRKLAKMGLVKEKDGEYERFD